MLVGTPAPDGRRIKRSPHLEFAFRPHGALGFVETQNLVVPRQAAEGDKPPHFGLEVGNQLFILDFQKRLRRQYAAPVIHQGFCSPAITPKLAEVVGVIQPAGEELRVAGKTSVSGIAPHLNDARLRQRQVQKAQVPKIGRQLVDDAICMGRQSGKPHGIVAAEFAQTFGAQTSKIGWIIAAGEAAKDQVLHVLQLAGAVHIRMARQDLLHQRGARARHAGHEHRQVGVMPRVRIPRHRLGAVDIFQVAEKREDFCFVIRHQRAIDPVAFVQMRKSLGRALQLVIGLEQCEMQFGLLMGGIPAFIARQRFKASQSRIVFRESCRFGQRVMAGRILGGQRHRPRERLARRAEFAKLLARLAEREKGTGIGGLVSHEPFQNHLGFALPPRSAQGVAQSKPRPAVPRFEAEHLFKSVDRFIESPGPHADLPDSGEGAGVAWLHGQSGAVVLFGFRQTALFVMIDSILVALLTVHRTILADSVGQYNRVLVVTALPEHRFAADFRFPAVCPTGTVRADISQSGRMPSFRLPALVILVLPFFAGGLAGEVAVAQTAPDVLALTPLPQQIMRRSGAFTLRAKTPISCAEPGDTACLWTADYLAGLLHKTRGLSLPVDGAGQGIIFRRTGSITGEAYHLQVSPDRVEIEAGSDAGLLYGAVTLWQLASQKADSTTSIEIPALDIRDAPRFSWRGVMLDSARHYQPPAYIKSFIDAMVLHKLNVLQWHLTDDQGWRLQIKRYPRLTAIGAWRRENGRRYGGFYTQAEVREIVAYAHKRGVTIVPEIEMPGHARAAIVAYPKLGSARHLPHSIVTEWGVFPNLYNVNEDTFVFLENVLTEVMDLFPSSYIHIGGDEAPKDEWNASPSVQRRMRQLHIKDTKALQGYFTDRIGRFLEAHGRRLIGWDEILEGNPPAGAAVMSWRTVESAGKAAELGHDVVLSPSPMLYLDYCQIVRQGEPTCRGMQTTLEDVYAFNPAPKGALAQHLIGLQANIWTEHLPSPSAVSYAAFPRLAAFAENAWSPPEGHNWQSFLARLPAMMARYASLGITSSDAAFRVAITARPAPGGAGVSLSDQTGFGAIHYTTDGTQPTTASPLYTKPLGVTLPAAVSAAAFDGNMQLGAAVREQLDQASLLRRNSYTLDQCTNDLPLAQKGANGAVVMVNVMNPCWMYRRLDLKSVRGFDIAVTHMPFNFQIGQDIKKIPLYPQAAPSGQLEIHLDNCAGDRLALAVLDRRRTRLHLSIAPHEGVHDLCFVFARRKVDPVWALDWVQPLRGD